jgi:TonB family protein
MVGRTLHSKPRALLEPTLILVLVRPTMTRFLFILLWLPSLILAAPASPSAHDLALEKAARAVAIATPRPEYPYEARRARITGRGIAVMHVNPSTGVVTGAEMAQSTGHAVLDNAALSAFRRWRFKPGTVSMVRLPIAFAMAVTIYPNRWYPFSGVVRAVNVSAGTITVRGLMGTDNIIVNARTRLQKDGQPITLKDVVVSDTVQGRAVVRPPTFSAVAQSMSLKSESQ